jgi:metal-sulfur cluster biosynthetic enzyme
VSTEQERPAATAPSAGTAAPGPEAAGAAGERASSEAILDALSQVYDPEIGIDIVNLGLVYETALDDDGLLTVDMTLTSPYCPMGNIIQSQAHAVCKSLPGVEDVRVNLVWNPPWDPRTMASDEAKLDLGIF